MNPYEPPPIEPAMTYISRLGWVLAFLLTIALLWDEILISSLRDQRNDAYQRIQLMLELGK